MSDRERWIVYPLLLLAIGLALRNGVETPDEGHGAEVDVVRCKALEVMGPEGKPTVTITTSDKGDGMVETGNANGKLQSRLSANPSGGALQLLDSEDQIYAMVGHEGQRVGLFVGNAESGLVLPLSAVVAHPQAGEENSAEPEKAPAAPGKPKQSVPPAAEK
jgi:hypothetical protein